MTEARSKRRVLPLVFIVKVFQLTWKIIGIEIVNYEAFYF